MPALAKELATIEPKPPAPAMPITAFCQMGKAVGWRLLKYVSLLITPYLYRNLAFGVNVFQIIHHGKNRISQYLLHKGNDY